MGVGLKVQICRIQELKMDADGEEHNTLRSTNRNLQQSTCARGHVRDVESDERCLRECSPYTESTEAFLQFICFTSRIGRKCFRNPLR